MKRILMMVTAAVLVAGCGSDETQGALDRMWAGLSTDQRLSFCAEVRQVGMTAAADGFNRELSDRDGWDTGVAKGWIEGKCGD